MMTPKRVAEHLQRLLQGAHNAGGSIQVTLEEGFSYELIEAIPGRHAVTLRYMDHIGDIYSTELGTAQGDPEFKLLSAGLRGLDVDGEPLRVIVSTIPGRRHRDDARLDSTPR